MLWTGPRRVDSLFFVQRLLARRVTRQRLSSVMQRKLTLLCLTVTLALCAVVCVMWVRGYFAADEWFVSYEHTTEGVGAN